MSNDSIPFDKMFMKMLNGVYNALEEYFNPTKVQNAKPMPKAPHQKVESTISKAPVEKKPTPNQIKKNRVDEIAEYIELGWTNEQIATMCNIKLSSAVQYRSQIKKIKLQKQQKDQTETKEIIQKLKADEQESKAKKQTEIPKEEIAQTEQTEQPESKKVRMVDDVNLWIEKAKAQGKI